jgi:hypothetical protein
MVGGILYCSGFIILGLQNELSFFFSFVTLPLAIIFCVISASTILWGTRVHEKLCRDAAGLYHLDDATDCDSWLKKIYSEKGVIITSLLVSFLLISYFVLTEKRILPVSAAYYSEIYSRPLTFLYFVIIFTIIAYHAGLASYMAFQHVRFVLRISRSEMKFGALQLDHLRPKVKKQKELNDLVGFSNVVSACITIDLTIAIVCVLLSRVADWLTDTGVVVGVAVGLLFFLGPQFAVYRSIKRSKDDLVTKIWQEFRRDYPNVDFLHPNLELIAVYQLMDRIGDLKEWPINYERVFTEVMIAMLPLFVTYLFKI